MPLAASWMDPEIVIVCEISQLKKDRYKLYRFCAES